MLLVSWRPSGPQECTLQEGTALKSLQGMEAHSQANPEYWEEQGVTTTEGMRKAEILHKSLTPGGYSPLFLQNSSAEIQRRSLPEHRTAVSVLSWISGNIPKLWKTFSHILCCIYSQHNLLPLLTPVTWNVKPQNEQISPGAESSQNHGHVCFLQHHWMLWQFLTETNSKAWLMFLSLGNKNKF